MSGNPSEYENRDYCSQKNGRGPPAESEVRWQSTPSKRLGISLAPGCSTSANSPKFSRNSRVLLAAREWDRLWQSTLSVLILVFAAIS